MIELANIESPASKQPVLCYRYIASGNSQWSQWRPVRTVVVTDAEFEQINLKGN